MRATRFIIRFLPIIALTAAAAHVLTVPSRLHPGRGIIDCFSESANLSQFEYLSLICGISFIGMLMFTKADRRPSEGRGASLDSDPAAASRRAPKRGKGWGGRFGVTRSMSSGASTLRCGGVNSSSSARPLVRPQIGRHRQIAAEVRSCWRRPPRRSTGPAPRTRSAGSRSGLLPPCARAIAAAQR